MEINYINGGVCAPKGFYASGIHCGIRKSKSKKDLALIYSKTICNTVAVYTQNLVKGAPIFITQKNIEDGLAQAVICNSGNANTCNADGEVKAQQMCKICAKALNISEKNVVVASTGVIGQTLDLTPIQNGIGELVSQLSQTGNDDSANAIMTTDTHKKQVALTFNINGKTCAIGGMAKGSGMIHPNMATMLCFLTTDTNITTKMLQTALSDVVQDTFNMVSVDGDTSTNDMVSLMANGNAENTLIEKEDSNYIIFKQALFTILETLSKMIAGDGEGATKLLQCVVTGACDKANAKIVAKSVITSTLFKSAMFGADANWGRVLCAIGYSKANLNINKVAVAFESKKGNILVCKNGAGVAFDEAIAKEILQENEINILITLGDGSANATAWGCDLTYDYVKINGDYRT
ncbi:MAG: bifunctional glutamate N-acetyltransferase/amino-acid acetyltransferase ArgJ [Clostridia bacterium]